MNMNLFLKLLNALGETIPRCGISICGFCSSTKSEVMGRVGNRILANIAYGSFQQDLDIEKKMRKFSILSFEKLLSNTINIQKTQ